MAKSIKLKNNNYWDSSGIAKGRETLNSYFGKRLEYYNDTSASNIEELLNNKISQVETQLNGSQNGMMFLNGGWSGVNYAMGIGSKIGSTISVMTIFSDGIHIGRKYNNNYAYMHVPKNTTSYTLSATTGWKRIAKMAGMAGGSIVINNAASYGTMGQITFASGAGYNNYLVKNYKLATNGHIFTKARLVQKGNADCYLELYQNLAYSRGLNLKIENGFNVTLYNSEQTGGVPSGYTETQIDF